MTGPQYAPGTHVKATVRGRENVDAWRLDNDTWGTTVGIFGGHLWNDRDVTDVRPLVVLDPDDAEQVKAVVNAYLTRYGRGDLPSAAMQVVLRDLAPKPIPVKPDEPQGLGAVVETTNGTKYVRVAVHFDGWAAGREWQRIGGELNSIRNFGWGDIDVVRVLSEGHNG